MALVQEKHWHEGSRQRDHCNGQAGYEMYSQPSLSRKRPVGGCAVLVKAHVKGTSLHRFQDHTTGCGFEAVMVRVAGTNVACVSLYLQSGHFIDGEVNANILAELRSFLSSLRCPWFVAGDWNSHLPDVLGTRLNEVLKGQFLGVGQGTAGGVNELDFALIHPSMHRCVRVQSDWMVPFKPHCALHFTWQAESVKDLVPGLRVFSDDFDPVTQDERQGQIQPVRPNKALILEFQAEDPITVQCAAFSATAEAAGTLGAEAGARAARYRGRRLWETQYGFAGGGSPGYARRVHHRIRLWFSP